MMERGFLWFLRLYLTILSAVLAGITIDRVIVHMRDAPSQVSGGLLMNSKRAELTAQLNAAVDIRNKAEDQAAIAQRKQAETELFIQRFPSERDHMRLVQHYWARLYKSQVAIYNDAKRTIEHLQMELLKL